MPNTTRYILKTTVTHFGNVDQVVQDAEIKDSEGNVTKLKNFTDEQSENLIIYLEAFSRRNAPTNKES